MRCDTMLVGGCTGVTDGGPALSRHWVGVSYVHAHCSHARRASKTYCPVLNVCWPTLATLAQHLTDVGSVSSCAMLTHGHEHKTQLIIEQLLAGAGDNGPALNRHRVSVVLICSGLGHQPKIVMNIE